MNRRVAFFTLGLPDPTQGGTGIFNYFLLKALLDKKFFVDCYFRVNTTFLEKHIDGRFLEEFRRKSIQVNLIYDDTTRSTKKYGTKFVEDAHRLQECQQAVAKFGQEILKAERILALDLGWALALSSVGIPTLALLGDPLPSRLKHSWDLRYGNWSALSNRIRLWSIEWSYENLVRRVSRKLTLGIMAPQHAAELGNKRVNCSYFPPISYPGRVFDDGANRRSARTNQKFVVLQVGSLWTTASQMMRITACDVLGALSGLAFDVDIIIVGKKIGKEKNSSKNGLNIKYLGHIQNLDQVFGHADVFLAPMQYPVGLRVRVITALSYGMPVIADRSLSAAFPVLISGKDIFYFDTAEDIADILQTFKNNEEKLVRAKRDARVAWEAHYQTDKNCDLIIDTLFSIQTKN